MKGLKKIKKLSKTLADVKVIINKSEDTINRYLGKQNITITMKKSDRDIIEDIVLRRQDHIPQWSYEFRLINNFTHLLHKKD